MFKETGPENEGVKHSGMKEERHIFSAGITAPFLVPIVMLLCGGPHHVFRNGFGGSSSLVLLGHAQTCSSPCPPNCLLQFCGFTIAGILLLICIPVFISVYLVTVNVALCQQYFCKALKSAILFSYVKLWLILFLF